MVGPTRYPTRMLLELKLPPPVLVVIAGALMYGAAEWLPMLAYTLPGAHGAARAIAVVAVLIIGVAVLGFLHAGTTIDPRHPKKANTLVTSGLYRFSRNPMYLADLLLLVAWALKLGNWAAWLPVPLFVWWMNRFQIRVEEAALISRFGDAYVAYCRKVRRWL